jgi:hypothetical protein
MKAKDFEFIPPIPWWWSLEASFLPGKAHYVGCLIWLCYRLSGSKKFPIKFSRRYYASTALHRNTIRLGLRNLEKAGLIRVQRAKSKAPLVTIILDRGKVSTFHRDWLEREYN